ncbi:MAG: hypothetical protein NVSMB57_06570 [Actinomycetota bacterium]
MRGFVVRLGIAALIALEAGTGSTSVAANNRPAAPSPFVAPSQCQQVDPPIGASKVCPTTDPNGPFASLFDLSWLDTPGGRVYLSGIFVAGRDQHGSFGFTGVRARRGAALSSGSGVAFVGAAAGAGQYRYQRGTTKASFTGASADTYGGSFGATPLFIAAGADAGEYATNRGCSYVVDASAEVMGVGAGQNHSTPCVAPPLPPLTEAK